MSEPPGVFEPGWVATPNHAWSRQGRLYLPTGATERRELRAREVLTWAMESELRKAFERGEGYAS